MDLSSAVIVNGAYGKWYPLGQDRLKRSLIYNGYAGNTLFFCNEKINDWFNPYYPYTIKMACLEEAISLGYTHLLWVDCSVWSIKNPNTFFDIIDSEGAFFWRCSLNKTLAETAADSDLAWAAITRDEAEFIPEIASGIFGFRIDDPRGIKFWENFKSGNINGVCNTHRTHANQSGDKRFIYARQDQTLVSICLNKAGYNKIYDEGVYCQFQKDNNEVKDSVYWLIKGI